MADTNVDYDIDYDEYSALEAEAESLARGDAVNKKPANTKVNDPNMVPARVGIGRPPRSSQVTVVQSKQQSQNNVPRTQPAPQPKDKEISSMEEEEAMMSGEEETVDLEPRAQKWVAFHQPEKIGILNTETREIIEGYKDIGSASGMAKMLNEIDSIIVSGGYQ
jgi:hypothetical protein